MREILIYRQIGTGEKHYAAEMFANELRYHERNESQPETKIRFNCVGGSVFEGLAIISRISESGLSIKGMVDGLAASMGAFVFLSCDYREMNINAKLMLHLPKTAIAGDADELRATADKLDEMKNQFAAIIAKAGNITEEKAIELYLQPGKDVWLTAAEAKKAGLIHAVSGQKIKTPASANANELHNFYAQLLNKKDNKMNKQVFDLLKKNGLIDAEAMADVTDDAYNGVVENLVNTNAQLNNEITGLKAQVKGFEDAEAEARKNEIKAMLDGGIENKVITAEQRQAWQAMFDKDFDNAKALFNTLKPVPNIKDFVPGADGGKKPKEIKAELVSEYDKADRAGTLEKIKADNAEHFNEMFEAKWGKKPE